MPKLPSTPALRTLRAAKVAFEVHPYDYIERGGTRASSTALGVEEHSVIKTLVFEAPRPLIILMHGDREVSAKTLARTLGVKSARPCAPDLAQRHSGYKVGGTSPFGLRKALPIYAEATIFALPRIYINAGARGLLVSMDPAELRRVLDPKLVEVAQPR